MRYQVHKLLRVYVWELPVRVFHWLNALAIVVLCVTGYFISNPPAFLSQEEASFLYLFGTIRFIHFVAAYIFLINYIFRVYWGFVGNKYAHWKSFVPTNRKFLKEIWQVIKIDILLKKDKEHMAVGHNALAGFFYFLVFIVLVIQVITGFGLYADMSASWFAGLFAWVPAVFGSDFALRNFHHIAMWFFIVFAMIHVYLVLYHEYVEGRGEISSMGGGWKFIESDVFQKEAEEERKATKEELEQITKEREASTK